jgi:hypothetical protein
VVGTYEWLQNILKVSKKVKENGEAQFEIGGRCRE